MSARRASTENVPTGRKVEDHRRGNERDDPSADGKAAPVLLHPAHHARRRVESVGRAAGEHHRVDDGRRGGPASGASSRVPVARPMTAAQQRNGAVDAATPSAGRASLVGRVADGEP